MTFPQGSKCLFLDVYTRPVDMLPATALARYVGFEGLQ